jgi:hypothetical protein
VKIWYQAGPGCGDGAEGDPTMVDNSTPTAGPEFEDKSTIEELESLPTITGVINH